MSEDIKQMAHSLLNRNSQPAHVPKPQAAPKLKLPKHILDHAHEYVTKIMKLKGFL